MAVGVAPRALALASACPRRSCAVAAAAPGGGCRRRLGGAQLFVRSLSWMGCKRGQLKFHAITPCCSPSLVRRQPGFSSSVEVPASVRAMADHALDSPYIVVYVTVPDAATGTKLANGLVSNGLAACVNQVPGVQSTYQWEGKVTTDQELLLIIKTRQTLLSALTTHVRANHPYSVPEVIALPILGGSPEYLKWLADSTEAPTVS